MSVLRHKDYQGSVQYDAGRLHLRILHIDDLITAEVDSASEAEAAFAELVDDYLATCAAVGKQPSKPFKGSFNVRISPEMHKQLAFAAAENDETLNSYCDAAFREKLAASAEKQTIAEPSAWKGFLRLSLVTCPIIAVPTSNPTDRQTMDTTPTLDIDAFVSKQHVQNFYFANTCLIMPSGHIGHDAFAVIRETLRASRNIAMARAQIDGEERMIALEPYGNGMIGSYLRRSWEVASWLKEFKDVQDVKVTKDMLDLSKHIVDARSKPFDVPAFEKQIAAEAAVTTTQSDSTNVIDLMDALRRSQQMKVKVSKRKIRLR